MLSTILLSLASAVSAYPGMGSPNFHASLLARDISGSPSNALIGDLTNLSSTQLTATGSAVAQILTGQQEGQTPNSPAYYPAQQNTQACAQDTCCIWHYIAQDMVESFSGESGRCNNLARKSIRLGFHDAAGWSLKTGPHGGADGSIVLAPGEAERSDNRGLEAAITAIRNWKAKYPSVSVADLIQFGAMTATIVCPLGPRVRFFSGRLDSYIPAAPGLLPQANESAAVLTARFRDMTIEPAGLIALIGAHTTSQQEFVDPARVGDPQDSTPGVWDTAYYAETLGLAPPRVFKFQSDVNLAHAYTGEWQSFIGAAGQAPWDSAYAREYVRLSLLGVYNINNLTECTQALPQVTTPGTSWTPPDQEYADMWMSVDAPNSQVAQTMQNGGLMSGVASAITRLVSERVRKREVEFEA